jgi:hypothetical protein
MNRFLMALLPLVLALSSCAAAPQPDEDWNKLNDEVHALYEQGQYARAIVVAKKALEVAEKTHGPNHPNVASTLENLATVYRATDRAKEAEPLEKRAAEIRAMKR